MEAQKLVNIVPDHFITLTDNDSILTFLVKCYLLLLIISDGLCIIYSDKYPKIYK